MDCLGRDYFVLIHGIRNIVRMSDHSKSETSGTEKNTKFELNRKTESLFKPGKLASEITVKNNYHGILLHGTNWISLILLKQFKKVRILFVRRDTDVTENSNENVCTMTIF